MPSINAIIPDVGCTSTSFDPFVALYLLYGLSLVEELPMYQLLDLEVFQPPLQFEMEVLQPPLQLELVEVLQPPLQLEVEVLQPPLQLEVEVLQPPLQLVENAQLVGHEMQQQHQ